MEKSSTHVIIPPMNDSDEQIDPWLLISTGTKLQNHAFYSISTNNLIKANIPELRNKQISSTCYHGWIVLIERENCCLLNTTTNDKIQLPRIETDPESAGGSFFICVLSKPPTDPDCHLLFIPTNANFLLYSRLGDDKFTRRSRRFEDRLLYTAINFNGKVYAYVGGRLCSLVEVDFVGNDVVLKQLVNEETGRPCEIASPNTTGVCSHYLMDSCGELLLVHMTCYKHSAEVAFLRIFRIDVSEKVFVELKSVGDRALFVGHFGSMAVSCSGTKLKGNCVYYIWKERFLYVYDIEDRSKALFKLCRIRNDTQSFMSWVIM